MTEIGNWGNKQNWGDIADLVNICKAVEIMRLSHDAKADIKV